MLNSSNELATGLSFLTLTCTYSWNQVSSKAITITLTLALTLALTIDITLTLTITPTINQDCDLPVQASAGSQGSTEKEAAVQRMMQSMPSADFIAKALGIEQSSIESLQQQQQGKSYLAQQLTNKGVQPGATLMDARSVAAQPGEANRNLPYTNLPSSDPLLGLWAVHMRAPQTPTDPNSVTLQVGPAAPSGP